MFKNNDEKLALIERLPDFELSYDNILHKKVSSTDCYIIIPKGKKVLLWFTYWRAKNVCFTLFLNENGNISGIENYIVCFDQELSYGTLVHGTIFEVNGLKHFSCENIYYYKGHNIENYDFYSKLNILSEIFTYYIKQVAYNKNFLLLGLPIINKDYYNALNIINKLPYKVYGIKQQNFHNNNGSGILLNKQNNQVLQEAYFNVKATTKEDIYELYCASNPTFKQIKPYAIALIQSYKNSVLMNSLFRNIRENENLDLLEESEDEEDFENINENKYVDLDRMLVMKCVYVKKFRKWQPIELVKPDEKIKLISYKEAQVIEKGL